jgi:hypothetical protein
MRLSLNAIRITGEAERNWQRRTQEASVDRERRAVRAGDARRRAGVRQQEWTQPCGFLHLELIIYMIRFYRE